MTALKYELEVTDVVDTQGFIEVAQQAIVCSLKDNHTTVIECLNKAQKRLDYLVDVINCPAR